MKPKMHRPAPVAASLVLALGAGTAAPAGAANRPEGAAVQGHTGHSYVSGCLTDRGLPAPAAAVAGCERVDVTAGIATVLMRHEGAILNCCGDVSVDTVVDGATIRFVERQVGEPCHCLCPYNLSASVDDLAAGKYVVEVRGPRNELVWVQFVEVFPAPPQVVWGFAPCPLDPNAEDPPETAVEIAACAGKLTVKHLAARVNCCLELAVEMTEDDGRIVLTEVDAGEPCLCTCTTDIMIGVDGLAPGRYLVDLVDVTGTLAGSAVVDVAGPRPAFRRAGAPR